MTHQHKDTPESFWERMGMTHNLCSRCRGTGIDPKYDGKRTPASSPEQTKDGRGGTWGKDEKPPCPYCNGTGDYE